MIEVAVVHVDEGVRMKVAGMSAVVALVIAAVSVVGSTTATGLGGVKGDPVKGRKVYLNANPQCSLCHMIGASGGKFGPDLTAIGKKRDAAWLAKYLPNPKFENPANKMPAVTVKGKDLEDLIAYLVSLKGKK